jgi:hypothetical protein
MELHDEFLVEMFFSYCRRPVYKKYQNIYNAECPVCREGKSRGRTRRLFYFPSKKYLYCHNCSKSWKPFEWVKDVTNLTLPEILKKNAAKSETQTSVQKTEHNIKQDFVLPDLPDGCVDLTDPTQLEFYKNNKIVLQGLEYCKSRKLFDAVNSCDKFYVCLGDKVHKNRLIIPFYNESKKITCYQSRSLNNEMPKYLTKYGEKEVFGINNVDVSIPYVFVFEGPIDSMFVKNGIAIASLSPTEKQITQINSLIGFEIIYVFDNDKGNKQVARKIKKCIQDGKNIFIWPNEMKPFKDFNEVCVKLNMNEISWNFVVKNSFKGPAASLKLTLNSNLSS